MTDASKDSAPAATWAVTGTWHGPFADLAPAALPVSPDWLPIGTYPSYRKAALSGGAAELACAGAGLPQIIGPDGPWSMGCLCGLL